MPHVPAAPPAHLPPPVTQFEVSGTTQTAPTPFSNLRTALQFVQQHFPEGSGAVTITARRMGAA